MPEPAPDCKTWFKVSWKYHRAFKYCFCPQILQQKVSPPWVVPVCGRASWSGRLHCEFLDIVTFPCSLVHSLIFCSLVHSLIFCRGMTRNSYLYVPPTNYYACFNCISWWFHCMCLFPNAPLLTNHKPQYKPCKTKFCRIWLKQDLVWKTIMSRVMEAAH